MFASLVYERKVNESIEQHVYYLLVLLCAALEVMRVREAFPVRKVEKLWTFSIAFGGVFPNISKATFG